MKEIKLSQQGKNKDKFVALVDDEDYDYLNQWRWFATSRHGITYARREIKINGNRYGIAMHNAIMQTPDKLIIDHIDRNGLNNQKSNLRYCSLSQNQMNVLTKRKYKGVDQRPSGNFNARIKTNHKIIYLGTYPTAEEAAMVYNINAKKYFGEFARLNIINEKLP